MSVIFYIILMCLVLLLSVILTKSYTLFAINNSIIANPNERTLHEKPIPREVELYFQCYLL